MSATTIRKALGTLQDDPDQGQAWSELADAVGFHGAEEPLAPAGDLGMDDTELAGLLEAARHAHDTRGEFDAVARLLEMEVALAHGTGGKVQLATQLAHVLHDQVMDDARAVAAYRRLLAMRPGDPAATEAIEASEAKGQRWSDIVLRYEEEARGASDPKLK